MTQMPITPETALCEYVTEAGRHELVAVLDELSLTYRVLVRHPDGTTRVVRELVPSRLHARRWASHYRRKTLAEASDSHTPRSFNANPRNANS